MNDFESKELDKTFETILFVDNYSREPNGLEKAAEERAKGLHPKQRSVWMRMLDSIKIAPAPGGSASPNFMAIQKNTKTSRLLSEDRS